MFKLNKIIFNRSEIIDKELEFFLRFLTQSNYFKYTMFATSNSIALIVARFTNLIGENFNTIK